MKWSMKRELIPLISILIVTLLAIHYYQQLPDPMPSHFDSHGYVNGWMDKNNFFTFLFSIMIGIYLIMTFIPFIDPLRKKIEGKYGIILLLRDIAVAVFVFIFILILIAALEGVIHSNMIGVALGIFFIVIGSYIPKLPRNLFVKICTVWMITSDKIWNNSRMLGGWLFTASGLVLIVFSFLKVDMAFGIIVSLIPTAIISGFTYPFSLNEKHQKSGEL